MSAIVFIRQAGEGEYQWYSPELPLSGEYCHGSLADLAVAVSDSRSELWLLLPGDRIGQRLEPMLYRERRHIPNALPFQMEDSLLGDIEAMQFAYAEPYLAELSGEGDALTPVGWCEREWLHDCLQGFQEAGLELHRAVPESLLLRRSAGWTLFLDDLVHCHLDKGYGFSVHPAGVESLLKRLFEERGPPALLRLAAAEESTLHQLQRVLPQNLSCPIETRLCTFWQELDATSATEGPDVPELDMLQGEFARRLPLARWWRQSRGIAALLCIALSVWLASQGLVIYRHHVMQSQADVAVEAAFRSVVPEGLLVDAEQQLRHRLSSLGGSQDYRGPVALLSRVAPLLAEDDSILIRGMTWNLRQGDLRLNFHADSFTSIEQLRSRMTDAGLDAELVHSSADGEGQQARFRVAWGVM